MIKAKHNKGDTVTMTEDALKNYGEKYRDQSFQIEAVSTQHMPAKEFFLNGKPDGFHPGFDASANCALYDLNGLSFSLYEWEVQ